MDRVRVGILYIACSVGGFVVIRIAHTAAMASTTPNEYTPVMLITAVVFCAAYSFAVAYGVRCVRWYVLLLGPLLYYGLLAVCLRNVLFLWIDMRLPLLLITTTLSAFVGTKLRSSLSK